MARTKTPLVICAVLLPILVLASCQTMPETDGERAEIVDESKAELKRMTDRDPWLAPMLEQCAGYAIFPEVGKGGLLFGGAWGRGAVYRRGGEELLGYATVTQASVGGVVGGQMYGLLLIFQGDSDLEKFTGGDDLRFGAGASAIAVTEGASKQTKFSDGVAVFIRPRGGLMADASLSGQGFSFVRPDGTSPAKEKAATRPAN